MDRRYFMMSQHFNKSSPDEFGLVPTTNPDIFILPQDNSKWKYRQLYDFGWGNEEGYFRIPLPDFHTLLNIIMFSDIEDNIFGAAAVVLSDYPEELLKECKHILHDENIPLEYLKLFKILNLDKPLNRSPIIGKSLSEISQDYEIWKNIADAVRRKMDG